MMEINKNPNVLICKLQRLHLVALWGGRDLTLTRYIIVEL